MKKIAIYDFVFVIKWTEHTRKTCARFTVSLLFSVCIQLYTEILTASGQFAQLCIQFSFNYTISHLNYCEWKARPLLTLGLTVMVSVLSHSANYSE